MNPPVHMLACSGCEQSTLYKQKVCLVDTQVGTLVQSHLLEMRTLGAQLFTAFLRVQVQASQHILLTQ